MIGNNKYILVSDRYTFMYFCFLHTSNI